MKEELLQALANTVLGICTVVGVLVIIALVIYCFKFIPMLQAKFAKKTAQKESAQAMPEPAAAPAQEDVTDDLEIVAVIAAAIAAGTGMDPGSFTVRSVKRRY